MTSPVVGPKIVPVSSVGESAISSGIRQELDLQKLVTTILADRAVSDRKSPPVDPERVKEGLSGVGKRMENFQKKLMSNWHTTEDLKELAAEGEQLKRAADQLFNSENKDHIIDQLKDTKDGLEIFRTIISLYNGIRNAIPEITNESKEKADPANKNKVVYAVHIKGGVEGLTTMPQFDEQLHAYTAPAYPFTVTRVLSTQLPELEREFISNFIETPVDDQTIEMLNDKIKIIDRHLAIFDERTENEADLIEGYYSRKAIVERLIAEENDKRLNALIQDMLAKKSGEPGVTADTVIKWLQSKSSSPEVYQACTAFIAKHLDAFEAAHMTEIASVAVRDDNKTLIAAAAIYPQANRMDDLPDQIKRLRTKLQNFYAYQGTTYWPQLDTFISPNGTLILRFELKDKIYKGGKLTDEALNHLKEIGKDMEFEVRAEPVNPLKPSLHLSKQVVEIKGCKGFHCSNYLTNEYTQKQAEDFLDLFAKPAEKGSNKPYLRSVIYSLTGNINSENVYGEDFLPKLLKYVPEMYNFGLNNIHGDHKKVLPQEALNAPLAGKMDLSGFTLEDATVIPGKHDLIDLGWCSLTKVTTENTREIRLSYPNDDTTEVEFVGPERIDIRQCDNIRLVTADTTNEVVLQGDKVELDLYARRAKTIILEDAKRIESMDIYCDLQTKIVLPKGYAIDKEGNLLEGNRRVGQVFRSDSKKIAS